MSGAEKNLKSLNRSSSSPPSHTAPIGSSDNERDVAMSFAIEAFSDPSRPYEEQKEAMNAMFTRSYLQKLMAAANGNQSLAARTAGLDRTYLGRLLLKYGMRS